MNLATSLPTPEVRAAALMLLTRMRDLIDGGAESYLCFALIAATNDNSTPEEDQAERAIRDFVNDGIGDRMTYWLYDELHWAGYPRMRNWLQDNPQIERWARVAWLDKMIHDLQTK